MSQGDTPQVSPSDTGAADPGGERVPTAQSNTPVDETPDGDGVHMSEQPVDTDHDDDRSEG